MLYIIQRYIRESWKTFSDREKYSIIKGWSLLVLSILIIPIVVLFYYVKEL